MELLRCSVSLHPSQFHFRLQHKHDLSSIYICICRRSIGYASIFVFGYSGAGKSSTVNHLLGFPCCKVNNEESQTRATTEYRLVTPDPSLSASDITLGIIDTPGATDTSDFAQGACNIASVIRFRQKHPDMAGVYPNIVLVMVQATDTRWRGKNSSFEKSLKALKKINIVDKHKPNVVVVVTWACSVVIKNPEKWRDNLREKGNKVNQILMRTVGVQGPVVYLENEYGEEKADLPVVGDCTMLPDGTLQPKNLIEAMNEVMERNGDDFGRVSMLRFFGANGVKVEGKPAYEEWAKMAEVSELDELEKRILDKLTKAATTKKLAPVTKKVNDYIESNSNLTVVSNIYIGKKSCPNARNIYSRMKGTNCCQWQLS